MSEIDLTWFKKSKEIQWAIEQHGYLTYHEGICLAFLANTLPHGGRVINIGAGAGTSALIFMSCPNHLNVWTIDIQEHSSPFGALENEKALLFGAGFDGDLGGRWKQFHGDSAEIGKFWLGRGIYEFDCIYVDGNHTYEGCMKDLRFWSEMLADNGAIAVHDFEKATEAPTENARSKPHPGVDKAVKEFIDTTDYFVDMRADTLIVLGKSK